MTIRIFWRMTLYQRVTHEVSKELISSSSRIKKSECLFALEDEGTMYLRKVANNSLSDRRHAPQDLHPSILSTKETSTLKATQQHERHEMHTEFC